MDRGGGKGFAFLAIDTVTDYVDTELAAIRAAAHGTGIVVQNEGMTSSYFPLREGGRANRPR